MKIKKNLVALSVVAATIASMAAMPASAKKVNDYNLSYETLTESVTTTDGNIIPAGSVAITMSISENTGFTANTFKLNVDDKFSVIMDDNDQPIIEKQTVLCDALIGVAENDGLVCVTAAAGQSCDLNGDLFTIYAATTNSSETECAEIANIQSENISASAALSMLHAGGTNSIIEDGYMCYFGGDCNNDNVVNSVDASLIMMALKNVTPKILNASTYTYSNYFPSVIHRNQPDANGDGYITHFNTGNPEDSDAQTILSFSASAGAGNEYTGYGSATVGQKIRAYHLA